MQMFKSKYDNVEMSSWVLKIHKEVIKLKSLIMAQIERWRHA